MVADSVSKWLRGFLASLQEWLLGRVIWTADDGLSLAAGPAPRWALLLIWGRECYREVHRDYPINRWSDALAVARTEAATLGPCMLMIGKFVDGRRRVTFYVLDAKGVAPPVKALLWLPESALVNAVLPAASLATVDRRSIRYFLSNGESQIAGGVIQTAERFALASGIRAGWQGIQLDESGVRKSLREGIVRLERGVWTSALSPDLKAWFMATRRPLLVGVAAFVLIYMALVTSYVSATLTWRESSVAEMAETVAPLLKAQKRVEVLRRERSALLQLHRERKPVLPIWGGLDAVWRAGGLVQAVNWDEKRAAIRGRAPDATAVLAALRKVPQIKGAGFSAAVRQESGNQEFVIQFEIDPSVPFSATPVAAKP